MFQKYASIWSKVYEEVLTENHSSGYKQLQKLCSSYQHFTYE